MQTKTVTILSVQEAREALVQHYTNFMLSNRDQLAVMLREGSLMSEIPNLKAASPAEIVQLYRDNAVGATDRKTEMVVIQVNNVLEVVFDKPLPVVVPPEIKVVIPEHNSVIPVMAPTPPEVVNQARTTGIDWKETSMLFEEDLDSFRSESKSVPTVL